ncbi:MAG: peptidoglycan-binding protein [Rhodobacteraceae bacterium]|nr:MAG: peptidoglycan-binding protein [Paracoccaceae bacterium]
MTSVFGRTALLAASVSIAASFAGQSASAQEQRWVQVEAHRELDMALERAAQIEARLGSVSGFRLPSNWYALSIGPYENEIDAFTVRRQLRAERAIPADAFVSTGSDYLEQVYPVVGASALEPMPEPEAIAEPDQELLAAAEPEPEPEPEPEETLREAQASERLLDRDGRAELQTALQWFGYYTLAIDAAFGPGTRRSMAAWQEDRGYETTGVLTTRQRAELLAEYEAELAALGMETVRDEVAGISIDLPMAMVAFDRHETPFAHYFERDDSGVRVLLISQEGTQATLFGLYEIMQTLEIVPLEGARERRQNSFVLTGQSDTLRSHTVAQFRNGEIKGWTLIWTPERDEQMARVLPMMEASFATLPGTLPESAGQASTVRRGDLLAGLSIRRPDFSRSGFYVDATGTVLTSAAAVAECGRVTIDEAYNARVVARDEALGLAVLQPETPLVPLAFAQFNDGEPPLGAKIRISGFSFEDVLSRPILTNGRVEDTQGMQGETGILRLSAEVMPGDLGGPVFGPNGAVIGLLTGQPQDGARQWPADVNYAVDAQVILDFLRGAQVSGGTLRDDVVVPDATLTRIAPDLTVLVSCWN